MGRDSEYCWAQQYSESRRIGDVQTCESQLPAQIFEDCRSCIFYLPEIEGGTTEHLEKKRDIEKEMWRAGFRYSWRKMEIAAQNSWMETISLALWPMLLVPPGVKSYWADSRKFGHWCIVPVTVCQLKHLNDYMYYAALFDNVI